MTDATPNPIAMAAAEDLVSGLDAQLAAVDEMDEGGTERRRYKLRTVIERCGWDRRSEQWKWNAAARSSSTSAADDLEARST